MRTTRAMTLMMRPESDGRVSLSRTWREHRPLLRDRMRLLWLMSPWTRPAGLRAALSADELGSCGGAQTWTDAPADVVAGGEVRFAVRGGVRGDR